MALGAAAYGGEMGERMGEGEGGEAIQVGIDGEAAQEGVRAVSGTAQGIYLDYYADANRPDWPAAFLVQIRQRARRVHL